MRVSVTKQSAGFLSPHCAPRAAPATKTPAKAPAKTYANHYRERLERIKREHWQKVAESAPQQPPKKPRRSARPGGPVPRDRLQRMHHVVAVACELNDVPATHPARRLLDALADCLARWPRVRVKTYVRLSTWHKHLMARLERGDPV